LIAILRKKRSSELWFVLVGVFLLLLASFFSRGVVGTESIHGSAICVRQVREFDVIRLQQVGIHTLRKAVMAKNER
jgi:hypothetical protein